MNTIFVCIVMYLMIEFVDSISGIKSLSNLKIDKDY